MAMPGLALLNAALLLALADWLKKLPDVRLLKYLPRVSLWCRHCRLAGKKCRRSGSVPHQPKFAGVLYGFSPFPESPEIARYLEAHTKPGETIAVLGSEPQIFFLAHRHSASGYIYVYPLTEPQPLAPAMRQEFKKEIETAKPEFVVHVNILSSWCSAVVPGQTEKILDDFQNWWDD